jgi:cyclin B
MAPDGAKDSLKPTMPPAAAVQTARVDEIQASSFAGSNVERPYMDRPSDDIDARDVDNPLLCTEYVNQMYDNFSVMERDIALNANYMSKQSFINEKMRAILCDWLVEVHLKFKMVPETLYLTINMLDRFLQMKQVRRSKLQLVGVACMSIAAKYEEIYPPELRDYVHVTDRAYSRKEIVEMESDVVESLQYNLTVPTIHSFLCRFLKAAHADRTMVQLACFLAERTLQEYSMCKFLPSVISLCRTCRTQVAQTPPLVAYLGEVH